jgi:hypothetical protein
MSDTPSYVPARTSTASGELQDWPGREPAVPVSALRALHEKTELEDYVEWLRWEDLAALCDQAEGDIPCRA